MKANAFVSFILQIERVDTGAADLIRAVDGYLASQFEDHELVIVDNTADADAGDELKRLSHELSGLITILELSEKRSPDIAMLAGANKAIGDFIFQMENAGADFEPRLLSRFFEATRGGFDIVFGSPKGVVLTSRRALNAALNGKHRFRNQDTLLALSGYAQTTINYESKISVGNHEPSIPRQFRSALEGFVAYSPIAPKIAFACSIGSALVTIAIGIHALVSYFLRRDINFGWTGLMIFLSVSFAGLFLVLGILGESLRLIWLEIQGVPLYVVKSSFTKMPRESSSPADEPRFTAPALGFRHIITPHVFQEKLDA